MIILRPRIEFIEHTGNTIIPEKVIQALREQLLGDVSDRVPKRNLIYATATLVALEKQIPVTVLGKFPNYLIATLRPDGTFTGVSSVEDGNTYGDSPQDLGFSDLNGIWKCAGKPGQITISALDFSFPNLRLPCTRALERTTFTLQTNKDSTQISGGYTYSGYKLESTSSADQKQVRLYGPYSYTVQGYKVFDLCEKKKKKHHDREY
ncbi:unnamed protein product [Didymodactylos carnosus]|uniref:Uncharacterized protein n=1 Tax=Didymodactylos carnosus TaxID=1234261 RepID=A0A8S2EGA2_9BILA|nr:unnamed protein product [Didymodactylos carnosus]CAF3938508.1 unnamed protein product [Didymodactylos carnosus]